MMVVSPLSSESGLIVVQVRTRLTFHLTRTQRSLNLKCHSLSVKVINHVEDANPRIRKTTCCL